MEYVIIVLIAILSVMAICVVGARKGVVDTGNRVKLYKPCEDIIPFKGKTLILIIIICFVLSVAVQISLYINAPIINCIKLYGVFTIVVCAALIDAKRKIIPNFLIICGLVFRAGIYIYEFFTVSEIKAVLINDLIGFVIGFVFLGLVSLLSKGALGFGDAKLFGIIGLTAGSFCTYSTLLASLIISVIFSVINIARKKMGRKDSFPFGPCIAIGYTVAILLTSY